MKINQQDISIEKLVKDVNPRDNMKQDYGNGIYLSKQEKNVLEKYHFSVENYANLKSLLFDIEEYLNENYEESLDDLENIADNLAELNYYQNTNK